MNFAKALAPTLPAVLRGSATSWNRPGLSVWPPTRPVKTNELAPEASVCTKEPGRRTQRWQVRGWPLTGGPQTAPSA